MIKLFNSWKVSDQVRVNVSYFVALSTLYRVVVQYIFISYVYLLIYITYKYISITILFILYFKIIVRNNSLYFVTAVGHVVCLLHRLLILSDFSTTYCTCIIHTYKRHILLSGTGYSYSCMHMFRTLIISYAPACVYHDYHQYASASQLRPETQLHWYLS